MSDNKDRDSDSDAPEELTQEQVSNIFVLFVERFNRNRIFA